jgi:hypothetical protein
VVGLTLEAHLTMAFTRRDLFWYCAGVTTVLVVGLLVHALNGSQNTTAAAVDSHTMSMPASAGTASDAAAPAQGRAGSMDEMLAQLEARLASQGGSDADWELLAQTYEFVGRGDDAKLARAHHLPPSAMTGASPAQSGAAPNDSAADQAAAAAAISGQVELAGALRTKVPDGLTLFIVAKSVDSPGPPVAIVRTTTGGWPLTFTLDDSSSMVPGRTLSGARRVTIEARVSRSGQAAPQPGDFQSSITTIDPHAASPVRIVIDHIIG